jgi:hypothetical protein
MKKFFFFFLYMKKRKKKHRVYWIELHISTQCVVHYIWGGSEENAMQRHEASAVSLYALGNKAPETKKKKNKQNNLSPSLEDSDHAAASRSVVNPIMQVLASVIRRQCILINIECGADTYIQYIYRKKMREIGHTRHKQRIWGRLTQQLAARFKKVDVR